MSEPLVYDRASVFQRALRRFAASGPGSWLFARVLHHIDRRVHRLTRGRYTFASLYPGFSQYERRATHRDISVFVLESDDRPGRPFRP